jgi:hypothetical protein
MTDRGATVWHLGHRFATHIGEKTLLSMLMKMM